jgi:Protein of unknown function, DUF417
MFLTTFSFLFTTPGWEPSLGGFPAVSAMPGQFVLKDIVLPRTSQMIASERDADVRFGYEPQGFGDHKGGGGWTTRRVKRKGAGCGSRSTAG